MSNRKHCFIPSIAISIGNYVLLLALVYILSYAECSSRSNTHAQEHKNNRTEHYCFNKYYFQNPEDHQPKAVLSKLCKRFSSEDSSPLIKLIQHIALRYLFRCISAILYDGFFEDQQQSTLRQLLTSYPLPYVHGRVDLRNLSVVGKSLDTKCRHLLVLGHDLESCARAVGNQDLSHVVLVTAPGTTRYTVLRFLATPHAQLIVNLLILRPTDQEIYLYTHRLYVDGLGSSEGHILTTWRCDHFTRPAVPLFKDRKLRRGFGGHRFLVATGQQPPYVFDRGNAFKEGGKNAESSWDGIEVRILWLMAETLNFTVEFYAPPGATDITETGNAIVKEILLGRADLAVGSIYMLPERMSSLTMSPPHSQDCATFMTVASTALPRYRAIMGPFHWTVWLALTLAYLLAIFPIAFSARHTLFHLLSDPWEMENMFWYVFGTFTNCFTFRGKFSWSRADKYATRMLIGWYWLFSIIVTAYYTGSIIAFVTLPVFPEVTDTSRQILEQGFLVGTLGIHGSALLEVIPGAISWVVPSFKFIRPTQWLSPVADTLIRLYLLEGDAGKGGWKDWFNNSADPVASKLIEKMEYLPDLDSAFVNVSQPYYYYRGYAFLGSQHILRYFILTNHTKRSTKSHFHLGAECFVPFNVGFGFQKHAPYSDIMGYMLLRIVQHGFMHKLTRDMEWSMKSADIMQVSASSSLRVVRTVERKLTLEDVQGMFLLLAAGFAIAFLVLFMELTAWALKKLKSRFSKQQQQESGYKEDKTAQSRISCVNVHMPSSSLLDQDLRERANRLQQLFSAAISFPSSSNSHSRRPRSLDEYFFSQRENTKPNTPECKSHHITSMKLSDSLPRRNSSTNKENKANEAVFGSQVQDTISNEGDYQDLHSKSF